MLAIKPRTFAYYAIQNTLSPKPLFLKSLVGMQILVVKRLQIVAQPERGAKRASAS